MSDDDKATDMINYQDVDEVIGLAERLRSVEEEMLSEADLQEVADELDIPERFLNAAKRELRRRRRKEREEEEMASRRWRAVAIVAAGLIGSVGAIFTIWSLYSLSQLRDLHATVESHQAEVENVRERKAEIEQQFEDRPDSLEKDAQLVGSENRLRVAKQRFNDVAARYNREARSFPNTLFTGSDSLPERVDLTSKDK